jgi:pyridoxal phosphate enzyme (YggS family)
VPGEVADRLSMRHAAVCARIAAACARAGRSAADVGLVAVTKGVAPEVVRAAAALGIRRFGESYGQEAERKRIALADVPALEWHFIGRVQRNKAATIAASVLVHSVADARVGAALDREGGRRGVPVRALVQVNVAGEASKAGVSPAELAPLLAELRAHRWLRVEGLMTIPPPLGGEAVRPFFAALRVLRDRQTRADELRELSMGMSGDFEIAVEEGATLVRVGTALFGARKEAV